MEDERPEIDLNRYRNHKRSVPWALIRKIIIAGVLIGLTYYMTKTLKEKKDEPIELPTEVEL